MTTVPTELDRRFREAAGVAGLIDVAYDVTDSPIGPLLVAVFLIGMLWPAIEYVIEESYITSAALNIPMSWRVAAVCVSGTCRRAASPRMRSMSLFIWPTVKVGV